MGSRNHPFCQQVVLQKHKIRIFKKIIVFQEEKKSYLRKTNKQMFLGEKGGDILLEDQQWPTMNIVTFDPE